MNVYIFLSQRDDTFRTGFNAERTALAPVGIHDDGTFKFSHSYLLLCFYWR